MTPIVDAAVRAGCAGRTNDPADPECPSKDCWDKCSASIEVWIALRVALPSTPSAETIEAMQYAACKLASGCGCTIVCVNQDQDSLDEMMAAYQRIPIIRELWPEKYDE